MSFKPALARPDVPPPTQPNGLPTPTPTPPVVSGFPETKVEGNVSGGVFRTARPTIPVQTQGWTLFRNPPQPSVGTFHESGPRSEVGETEGASVVGMRPVTEVPFILQPLLSEVLKRHQTRVFSGEPSDFLSWREAWEGFLTTAKSTAGSANIPDDALFLLFKSWLDPASEEALQAKRRDTPALTFHEFCGGFWLMWVAKLGNP